MAINRPVFDRHPGEMGIHLDFSDAEALNPKEYGSQMLFQHELLDKLYTELAKVPFDLIKGAFENNGLLDGVIMENFHKGVILAVSFDYPGALDSCWKEYNDGKLGSVFSDLFITPALLKKVGAKKIQLRTRIYQEEYDKCREELKSAGTKTDPTELQKNDVEMLKQVKSYQKVLAGKNLTLRDELAKFEGNLSEFLMLFKHTLGDNIPRIDTMDTYDKLAEKIKRREGVKGKRLAEYVKLRQTLVAMLTDMEINICHKLAQVHASSENQQQRDRKKKMKKSCAEMKHKLTREFVFGKLKHPELISKLLPAEQNIFLGLLSVPAYGFDTVVDTDQSLDEYMSGFETGLL